MAEKASAVKITKRKAQAKEAKPVAPKPAATQTIPVPSQSTEPGTRVSKPETQTTKPEIRDTKPAAPSPQPNPTPEAVAQKPPQPTAAPAPAPALPPPPPSPAAIPAPKEPQPPKKDDFVDYISEPFGAWWSFTAANFKEYYVRLLKLNFARLFVMIGLTIGLLIILIASMFAGAYLQWNIAAIAAIIVLALLCILVVGWADQCFESAAFSLTEAQANRKPFSILNALNFVKGVTFRYVLVDALVRFVFCLPAIIVLAIPLIALFSGSVMASTIFFMGFWVAYLFFIVYGFFANLLLNFLTQFWRYGFLFEGMGVIASLKGGVSLIKRRFPEVLVSDFIIIALILVASIPYFIFFGITWLGLFFLQMMAMAIPLVGLAIYLIAVFIVAIIAIFLTTIVDLAWRPAQYFVWRKVSAK